MDYYKCIVLNYIVCFELWRPPLYIIPSYQIRYFRVTVRYDIQIGKS